MQLSALGHHVIRGDTSHYDLVCNESAGDHWVELATGIGLFGVITTENISEQAIARAGSKEAGK